MKTVFIPCQWTINWCTSGGQSVRSVSWEPLAASGSVMRLVLPQSSLLWSAVILVPPFSLSLSLSLFLLHHQPTPPLSLHFLHSQDHFTCPYGVLFTAVPPCPLPRLSPFFLLIFFLPDLRLLSVTPSFPKREKYKRKILKHTYKFRYIHESKREV